MEFLNPKPIYAQIADYICEQIILKLWLAHEKIPSVRELAIQMQVNPNTVMRTYTFLEENQIIQLQRGKGYYVAPDAYQRVTALKQAEFIENELPKFFKTLSLLNISIEHVKKLYQESLIYEKE